MADGHANPNAAFDDESGEPTLPAALHAELRAIHANAGSAAAAPLRVDEAVLAAARRQLAPSAATPVTTDADAHRPAALRAWWANWRALGGALAAAAAVAIVIVLAEPFASHDKQSPTQPRNTLARHDLNRDGRVNIVDAYLIHRAIDQQQPTDAAWDVNEDGQVNAADAAELASQSVRLPASLSRWDRRSDSPPSQGGAGGGSNRTMSIHTANDPRVAIGCMLTRRENRFEGGPRS